MESHRRIEICGGIASSACKTAATQLRLGGLKLGLLINFGEAHLKNGIKRVINGHLDAENPLEFSL